MLNGCITVPGNCLKWIRLHRDMDSADEYVESLEADFNSISKFLPLGVDSILDIGCGLAGIDILLSRKYPLAEIHLMDNDGPGANKLSGLWSTMQPYNSREVANEFLAANGITKQIWHDIGTQGLKADLVISFRSWGFHYPLETYGVFGETTIVDIRGDSRFQKIAKIRKGWRCMIQEAA